AKPYSGILENHNDIAYRVIADHIRTLTFAISDGGVPSNEKRGYVLRSVLRRAERYGRQYLGFKEPFLHKLCEIVVKTMGDVFPELKTKPEAVAKIIYEEEEAFLRTMERGMKLFQEIADRTINAGSKVIQGSDVFDLHTTYGFFADITAQMAAEVGLTIDFNGYQTLLEKFKLESGKDRKTFIVSAVNGEIPHCDEAPKYLGTQANAKILGWIENNTVYSSGVLKEGIEVALLLDKSCFYAEQGGQVGDSGTIKTATGIFKVENTLKLGAGVLHVGKIDSGSIASGQEAKLVVDSRREDIRRNHTSTHLLNLALRQVLGTHVDQKGSLVDEDKTRFDFSHSQVITKDEIRKIENIVNGIIQADIAVDCRIMPLDEAKKIPGVRAVFGEKYPDPVRVVSIVKNDDPEFSGSVEFCGGTHLERTSQAGIFKIIGQESVGKGVRRLTAVTGKNAWLEFQKSSTTIEAIAEKLGCNAANALEKISSLQEELKNIKAQMKQGQGNGLILAMDKLLESAITKGASKIITGEIPAGPVDQIRQHLDRIRQKAGSCVALVIWVDDGKVGLMSAVSDDLQKAGVEAGKIIAEIAPVVDGKGGGPKGMAQAGGKNPAKVSEALQKAKEVIHSKIS
ncbi:MAG: alanine--tRNA ligase, partial [Planctomycetes bacterium]|nr:alanine--tRNA ligase [Planctomycetota bacterium]